MTSTNSRLSNRIVQRRGYVATAIGTVLGGVGLWVLGGYLGELYADRYMPNAGLEVLLPIIIGALGGYWIGVVAGAWVGLRVRSYPARRATAALVGLLAPLPVAAVNGIQSVFPADAYTVVPQRVGGLLVLATIGPVARALVLRGSKVNIRSSR